VEPANHALDPLAYYAIGLRVGGLRSIISPERCGCQCLGPAAGRSACLPRARSG